MLNKAIITEKSMDCASRGIYTFSVPASCTKHEAKVLVEQEFKVNVTKMTSVRKPALDIRTGRRRVLSSTSPTKQIRVWVKPGQTIALFDIKQS